MVRDKSSQIVDVKEKHDWNNMCLYRWKAGLGKIGRSALARGGDVNDEDCAGIRLNLSLSFISPPPAPAPSPPGIRRVAEASDSTSSTSPSRKQGRGAEAENERILELLLKENKSQETFVLAKHDGEEKAATKTESAEVFLSDLSSSVICLSVNNR